MDTRNSSTPSDLASFSFLRSSDNHDRMGSCGMSKFDSHVTKSPKAPYTDLHAFRNGPILKSGVSGNPGTKKGVSSGKFKICRHFQDERFIGNNSLRVASISKANRIIDWGIISCCKTSMAILLVSCLT